MNKIPIKKHLLVFACLLMAAGGCSILISNSSAFANESEEEQTSDVVPNKEVKKRTLAEQQEALRKKQALREQQLSEKKGRLDEARLKSCQRKEKTINTIMDRMAARGDKHLAKLNTISERTQAFYAEKSLSVSNYASLVADVNSKKAVAEAAVNALKSTDVDFKCDGSDPVGVGLAFNSRHKTEVAALKEYKTAVKNLVTAVKIAAQTARKEGNV